MILTIVTILLLIISFFAYASMWTIQFHFSKSWFAKLKDQNFWNPNLGANNKYKPGTLEPKFIFSTTVLVFLTDGFHRMQFIFENTLFLAFSLNRNDFSWYWIFIGIRVIYSIVFNLSFDKILIYEPGSEKK